MNRRPHTRTILDRRTRRLWLLALTILLPGIALAGFGLRSLQHERAMVLQEARDRMDRAAEEAARRLQTELARWSTQAGADGSARWTAVARARWPAAGSGEAPDAGRAGANLAVAADLDVDAVFAPFTVRVDAASHVDVPPGRLLYLIGHTSIDSDTDVTLLRGRSLYQIGHTGADSDTHVVLPPGFGAAETAELQANDYDRAAGLYEGLLTRATPAAAPTIVHRLARTYAKAGHREAAQRAFERLERMGEAPVGVGALPASLLGGFERCRLLAADAERGATLTCALDLRADLVRGRWPLEKTRYEYYASAAAAWGARATAPNKTSATGGAGAIADDSATGQRASTIGAIEQRKRLLTEQVAEQISALAGTLATGTSASGAGHRAWSGPDGVWLAIRQTAPPSSAASFLILPAALLRASVWPAVGDGLAADDLELTVLAPDGSVAFRAGGAAGAADPDPRVESTHSLADAAAPWRIQARGRGVDVVAATLVGRQRIYVGTLALMVASLIIGTLLVARTLRHEMQVAQLQSRFVAAVSHEFRTPLTSIRQLAELLDRGVPSFDRQRQYFKVILHESERLSRLVENVLDFARMDDGRKQYRFESVETAAFVGDVLREADRSLGPAGKHIVASVADNLPTVTADRQALAGALHNLIDNAAKYSPACDTIWVDVERDGDGRGDADGDRDGRDGDRPDGDGGDGAGPDGVGGGDGGGQCDAGRSGGDQTGTDRHGVIVRIRDRGIGIPRDEQPHVFDRFFRGRDLPASVQGTGLGLCLVKHVVDAHGGSIAIESAPGEGTTVTVRMQGRLGRT